ncbi:hypothetical protein [Mesorhizobium sp.]|uniref:hypothetical protein n=1 Tax=Mesorhizobium sp. TaxID=1871066 RepID=UPI0025E9C1CD|nr:hypothetical protein [Mesorhizobium sp.]
MSLPAADAHFLMLYLESAAHADILSDGSHTKVRDYPAGSVCLVDLSAGAAIRLYSRLHSLSFVLPRRLLAEVSQHSSNGPTDLRCLRGAFDPVLSSLSAALLPLFWKRGGSDALLRHLALAICAHLLHEHGDGPGPRSRSHFQ